MLTEADTNFSARDEALPGLGILLDPLAAGEAPGMSNLRPCYIRYKYGVNAVVAYRTEEANRP